MSSKKPLLQRQVDLKHTYISIMTYIRDMILEEGGNKLNNCSI